MLAEEQEIGRRPDFAGGNQVFLERGGFFVSDPSQIDCFANFHGLHFFIAGNSSIPALLHGHEIADL
jgi:hypothetical protein